MIEHAYFIEKPLKLVITITSKPCFVAEKHEKHVVTLFEALEKFLWALTEKLTERLKIQILTKNYKNHSLFAFKFTLPKHTSQTDAKNMACKNLYELRQLHYFGLKK